MAADGKILPTTQKFLFASMAGVAHTCVCYPLDLIKTRLQVIGEGVREKASISGLIKEIYKNEGVYGFYYGISASIVRQATYTGVRMGGFEMLVDYVSQDGKQPGLLMKCLCGAISGFFGGIAGLPADVVLTRMAADGSLPPEKRRKYKNIVDASIRIFKEEGTLVLFRGFIPTVVRAAIMNVSQLVSYVETKHILLTNQLTGDDTYCHVISSIVSAFVSTCCILPSEVAKIRIQNMRIVDGKPEYSGMIDAWVKLVSKEGVVSLWKGFVPVLIRNFPQFIVTFVVYENLSYWYKTTRM